MAKLNNNLNKVIIAVEVFPSEKEAFQEWIQGKYHSMAEAIRAHIRKVTGLNPESQVKNIEQGQN